MKNLAQQIAEAQAALDATTEGTPERAAAQARLGALNEAQSFHQSELNRVAGNTRGEGRNAREQEIAQELGVSVEKAKEIIEAHNQAEELTKTEIEKKDEELRNKDAALAQANQEKEDALKLADRRLVTSELRASLIAAGARADRVSRLVRDADVSKVEIQRDEAAGTEEVKNLEAVIETAKQETPEWFDADYEPVIATPGGSGGGDKGTPDPASSYIGSTYKAPVTQ